MTAKVFPIIPASAKALWIMLPIVLLLLVFIAFFGFIIYSSKNMKFELTDSGLKIKGGIYGRFIPKGSLMRDGARILNLNRETEFQPSRKTNGIGLPGYSEGWFRLKNGEKALLFLTERAKVVYIPTNDGYSVLLSPKHAEEMLNWMRELWRE